MFRFSSPPIARDLCRPPSIPRSTISPRRAAVSATRSERCCPMSLAASHWRGRHIDINDGDGNILASRAHTHLGWTAGAGIEYAADAKWSAKLEYDYIDLGAEPMGRRCTLPDVHVDPKIHTVKVGLNYKIWDGPASAASGDYATGHSPLRHPPTGTSTARPHSLPQGYPSFRSPYQGANSLPGAGASARPGRSAPFLDGGCGKAGSCISIRSLRRVLVSGNARPRRLLQRRSAEGRRRVSAVSRATLFLPPDFRSGRRTGRCCRRANQLAGKRDIDRVTVTVGRFAVGDFFDGNAYAKDPRPIS